MIEIPISRGMVVIVDNEYYEWLAKWKWTAAVAKHHFYAVRSMKKPRRHGVYMHQEVCPSPSGPTDHINGNTLDNRRANLRPATHRENLINSRKAANRSSIWKGVALVKRGDWRSWVAQAPYREGKRHRHLGYFKDECDAATAYNLAVEMEWGEFGRFNLPVVVNE